MVLTFLAAGEVTSGMTITCNGSACGGSGPRDYWYEVTLDQSYSTLVLNVGTGDETLAHYSNWYAAKWTAGAWVQLSDYDTLFGWGGPLDAHTPMTPHGGGPVTPNTEVGMVTAWFVNISLSAGTYGFGYDNPTDPMDVGWFIDSSLDDHYCDWDQPISVDFGPLHGPVPEPATISLLVIGGIAVLRRRK